MTDITEHDVHAATADLLDELGGGELDPTVIEQNFRAIQGWSAQVARWQLDVDTAIENIVGAVGELRRKPPRERRTGAAARVNPDDIRVFYWVLAGSLLLPLITFAASFQFQREFGAYTPLAEAWWWVIPCILELPLVVLTPMTLVFRRRKESTTGPWAAMLVLVAAACAINFSHAAREQGLATVTDWLAALFIGSWPILTLVLFKFFARLAVKPERPETPVAAPAARKAPTKKGTTR